MQYHRSILQVYLKCASNVLKVYFQLYLKCTSNCTSSVLQTYLKCTSRSMLFSCFCSVRGCFTERFTLKQKQKYRGMIETQKSGNKTSSGDIGLNIRTLASPKVGQDQVSGGVSVLCWHAGPSNEGVILSTRRNDTINRA